MSCVMPDGRVHESHVVWGDLSKGSVLSKGYAVQFRIYPPATTRLLWILKAIFG